MDNSRHEPDELYTLRNLFWLGNFQLAINEANSLSRIPAALHPERDEFVYRSYLALGQHNIVLSEVKDAPSTPIGSFNIKLKYKRIIIKIVYPL
jgi:coatomer protein complex subunit epsilon